MTMPNSSHLPRIDIGHTTSSDNFSAALYSELANRTGAHEYPASPTATDESALADKPLVTPLRPNPHRLHSSRSRTSLKQCLNGRNPSSPVSPAHPKSPPLVITSSTPGTASGLLQPQRYSPISSPSVQASHLPPISGATVLSSPSYSPAHRVAMSSELALTRRDNKQTHVEPSNAASPLDSLPGTSISTQRFPALKSPTTERLHNDARPPAASRTLSEAAMATTTATRHEDKPKANSTDHPGNRRNVMSVDSPPASKDPRQSLDDHGPDASDTSSVADSEFKSARNSSGFVETLTDMDNGLSALFECTRQSLNSTKDVITFLRRRALIEETYCQGMLKLSQDMTKLMAKEGVRDGTYKKAWSDILDLHEMAALNHIRFGNHLLEMAEELTAQHRDKDRLRRQ
ncbi:Rho GTPase-activating protein, partial [Dimargaris xerosporica]